MPGGDGAHQQFEVSYCPYFITQTVLLEQLDHFRARPCLPEIFEICSLDEQPVELCEPLSLRSIGGCTKAKKDPVVFVHIWHESVSDLAPENIGFEFLGGLQCLPRDRAIQRIEYMS